MVGLVSTLREHGAPAPSLSGTTIAGIALLSMGRSGPVPCSTGPGAAGRRVHPLFTREPANGTQGNHGAAAEARRPQRAGQWRRSSLPKTTTTCAASWSKALQNAGYEVISFDNGLSAYQRLREEPFELLLTDIVMPEMDGIELARRASELDPDIKIMFITGFAAVALNSDSAAPKNAKVLSKPVHLRELVNEVQKMLAA